MSRLNMFSWKDKILDYEIETSTQSSKETHKWTWKDKILDYEIETSMISTQILHRWRMSWKDKILDYEIETIYSVIGYVKFINLKR